MQTAFIGGGHMASAIIGGLRNTGTPGGTIVVADPVAAQLERLSRDFEVRTTGDNGAAAVSADVIVLAVKPQDLPSVAVDIAGAMRAQGTPQRRLFISIAAGVRIIDLGRWLGTDASIVRAMPNRPALIGSGITALFAGPGVTSVDRAAADRLLATCGATVWVDDEALMDTVTAVSGSGPAYFFLLIEALEAAGIEQGLAPDTARRLAIATAEGAGRLAAMSSEAPAVLRTQVTSKGGTTAAALDVFENGGLRAMVSRAVAAARKRSAELAAGAGRQ